MARYFISVEGTVQKAMAGWVVWLWQKYIKISHGNMALKSKKNVGSTPNSLCWKSGKHHDVGKNVFLRKTISHGNVNFGFYWNLEPFFDKATSQTMVSAMVI